MKAREDALRERTRPDIIDRPYVSNYPPLQAWLQKIEARCLEQIPSGEGPFASYIERWIAPSGKAFMIIVRPYRHGWDVYTSCPENSVQMTLDDAEERLK